MRSRIPALLMVVLLAAGCATAQGVGSGAAEFRKMKYGFFVHYVWGGDYGNLTINRNGQPPESFDALADGFDVQGFADDMAAWQVEYVIFTAWHANINPLFPSRTMAKWGLTKHVCKRDILRELIDALKVKGIKVMLYTHPRDGHDLRGQEQAITGWMPGTHSDPDWSKFDRQKWNDFTNELYAELVERYGRDVIGLFSDEGSGAGDSYRVVDYPRLRQTIKSRAPHLVLLQNYYGNLYSLDVGVKEYHFWGEFTSSDGNAWPTWAMPVATCFATTWWSATPAGKHTPRFSAEDMFRYTVLQAGACSDGGGVQWATGPYVGGGWETGVDETMRKLGGYIQPVAESIKQTYPSTSYVTPPGKKVPDLAWGVATKSTDERLEYIHVLRPPDGPVLRLPPPADGKLFTTAAIIPSGKPVALVQNDDGLTLTLPHGVAWDKLDTVIRMSVASASPPVNVAQGKAFAASSWTDTRHHPRNLTDGDLSTGWTSLADDTRPWALVDLGEAFNVSRIEVVGNISSGLELRGSDDPAMADAPVLATARGSVPQIVVKRAVFGVDTRTLDVTEQVRMAVAAGGLDPTVWHQFPGFAPPLHDPAPNVVKTLTIEYTIDGKEQVIELPEGQPVRLGGASVWTIDLPGHPTLRSLRIGGPAGGGAPLHIRELRVLSTPVSP